MLDIVTQCTSNDARIRKDHHTQKYHRQLRALLERMREIALDPNVELTSEARQLFLELVARTDDPLGHLEGPPRPLLHHSTMERVWDVASWRLPTWIVILLKPVVEMQMRSLAIIGSHASKTLSLASRLVLEAYYSPALMNDHKKRRDSTLLIQALASLVGLSPHPGIKRGVDSIPYQTVLAVVAALSTAVALDFPWFLEHFNALVHHDRQPALRGNNLPRSARMREFADNADVAQHAATQLKNHTLKNWNFKPSDELTWLVSRMVKAFGELDKHSRRVAGLDPRELPPRSQEDLERATLGIAAAVLAGSLILFLLGAGAKAGLWFIVANTLFVVYVMVRAYKEKLPLQTVLDLLKQFAGFSSVAGPVFIVDALTFDHAIDKSLGGALAAIGVLSLLGNTIAGPMGLSLAFVLEKGAKGFRWGGWKVWSGVKYTYHRMHHPVPAPQTH